MKKLKEFGTDFINVILFALCFTSCSPAERIARIIKRNPQLAETQTVVVRDTVIVPGLNLSKPYIIRDRDTIFDTIDNTNLQIFREKDTVRIVVKSTPDTVFLEKEVKTPAVKIYEPQTEKKLPILAWILIGLVGYKLFRVFSRNARRMGD